MENRLWLRDSRVARPAIVALIILLFVNVVGYIDRAAINILQIPIKAELGLSDTEIGLLIGLAFYLPYIIMAPPIARLGDRANRKTIIVVGVAFWSLMTGITGLASTFAALLLCRMGVAVGEAAGAPSSLSILSDYFPPSRRGAAIGLWSISVPLGSMLGIGLGGLLVALVGWRNVFVILGCGGLLFAPIIMLCLREPLRDLSNRSHEGDRDSRAAVRVLWGIRSFRYMTTASALHMFAMYSLQAWNAPFYVRVHHADLGQVAQYLGFATGVGGLIGSFSGGYIADLLARRDQRWYALLPGITTLLLIPAATLQLFVEPFWLSMVFATVSAVMITGYLAPTLATTQAVVPGNLRAFSVSIAMVTSSLFGGILGPLVSGLLSDLFSSMGQGEGSLRNAMLASLIFPLVAFLYYLAAARHVRADMAQAREITEPATGVDRRRLTTQVQAT